MSSQDEQDERIEALRVLMERLRDPELTLAEAKDLRCRVSDLLERDHRTGGRDRTGSLPVVIPNHQIDDGPLRSIWSHEPPMCATG